MHFAEKFSRGPQVQEILLLELYSICFENTPKNLVVQVRVQLERSSLIVKVGVEATCLHFNPWHILKETTEPVDPFGTCHKNPDILEKKLNWIVLPNSNAGMCASMQVLKQPEHGGTSTTEE